MTLYWLPVETFPRHVNNVYLLVEPGHTLLFDVGSGNEVSRRDLDLGFAVVRAAFGAEARFEDVDTAIVSHAHIDHFGGVGELKRRTGARLAVHELDARVLSCFEERVVLATKDVEVFLRRAGVDPAERERMLARWMASRSWFEQVDVDRALRDGDLVGNGHRVIHTPGHCPGQICLLVGDILLTSDHVLARITPHQFPQAITPFGGLEHYFHSLDKVSRISPSTWPSADTRSPSPTSAPASTRSPLPPRAPGPRQRALRHPTHHRRGRRRALRRPGGIRGHARHRGGGGSRGVSARQGAPPRGQPRRGGELARSGVPLSAAVAGDP